MPKSKQLKGLDKEEQLKNLINMHLHGCLQLNQFLHQNEVDEELQDLVQFYFHDLIDWVRSNMNTELMPSIDDPLILLRDNGLQDLEQIIVGRMSLAPLLSKHTSVS